METALPNRQGGGSMSSSLLNYISVDQHAKFLAGLVEALRLDNEIDVHFTTSLVMRSEDASAKSALSDFYLHQIRLGSGSKAASICRRYNDLLDLLLAEIAAYLAKLKQSGSNEAELVKPYLAFCCEILPRSSATKNDVEIFHVSLELLESKDQATATISKNVVFSSMSTSDRTMTQGLNPQSTMDIWSRIQSLCAAPSSEKWRASMGYALWLRWMSSDLTATASIVISEQYWNHILQGLRRGDAERRKTCLLIIRLSIQNNSEMPADLRVQYDRYCTVFETLILSHYLNQVVECEADLNYFASPASPLSPAWLFVLLGSALDPQMQDSNRKFIGNWVMKAHFVADKFFLDFFKEDFLPWAVPGQVSVPTLKTVNGVLRCLHGDRLAEWIQTIASSGNPSTASDLAEIILELLVRKRNSVFPYAVVYLVKGIAPWLTHEDQRIISQLPLQRMPEVPRDYVLSRLDPSVAPAHVATIASRRQVLEKGAIEKCASLSTDVEGLNGLWADVEYLEYPKALITCVPDAIFNSEMVEKGLHDPSLAYSLNGKLLLLLRIAETRTYLLPVLLLSIRKVLITQPYAFRVLDVEQFLVQMAKKPREPTADMLLEESTINMAGFSYDKYFGDKPSLGFAAYFDLVTHLEGRQEILRGVLQQLLHPWKTQKTPAPAVSVWKTTLQLQIMLLCLEQSEQTTPEAAVVLRDLFQILAIEPLPRYRYLLEWICTRLCLKHELQNTVTEGLETKDHHSNPKFLASLMKVGCTLACTETSDETFALQIANSFVPLAASSKVVIRHEAQWQFPVLMDHSRQKGWRLITENSAFASLDDYIRSLERFDDPPLERLLGRFDAIKDHNLTNLVEGKWFALDHTESPVTSHSDFIRLYSREPQNLQRHSQSCIPLGEEIPPLPAPTTTTSTTFPPTGLQPPAPRALEESLALQTKGTAYLARALTSSSSPNTTPRATSVIVVGSLVDNPYNLGGLSRASEVFGAAALALQNQNVVSNRDFTAVSVSSHLHIPLVQVSASAVPGWLAEQKREGFVVVGIEQTDRSVVLGGKEGSEGPRLPEKAVLVVGSERFGIPAPVLLECDLLVEIPQSGITRSLNVQTAVAIVLYEHARQHRREEGVE